MRAPLLLEIKKETQSLHNEIEKAIPMSEPSFSFDDYKNYLLFLFHFYEANEPNMLAFANHYPGLMLEKRSKRESLIKDLTNHQISLQTNKNWLVKLRLPLNNKNDLIGFLYVVEGSTLGGRIVAKILRDRFSQHEISMHFLNVYEEEAPTMWKSFHHWVMNHEKNLNKDDVLFSAKNCFLKFKEYQHLVADGTQGPSASPQDDRLY